MGTFTTLASVASFIQILLTVGAVVLGVTLLAGTVQWFAAHRPVRLARRESIPTYYLRGHAFSH